MTIHALRMKTALCAAALAAAAFATTAAQASASAEAKVTNVHIQLIDLDLNDGITPAIQLGFGSQNTASIQVINAVDSAVTDNNAYPALGAAYGPFTLSTGGAFATGDTRAGNLFGAAGGPGSSVAASATGADTWAWGLGNVVPSYFKLAPNTRMVITASVATFVQAAPDDKAFAYGVLAGMDLNNVYFASDTAQSSANYYGNITFIDPKSALQISFSNVSANAYEGSLSITASAYARSATAVPEPQSVALMLAGLGVLGAGTRRRSQRR